MLLREEPFFRYCKLSRHSLSGSRFLELPSNLTSPKPYFDLKLKKLERQILVS